MLRWFSSNCLLSCVLLWTLYLPLSAKKIHRLTPTLFNKLSVQASNSKYPTLRGVKGIYVNNKKELCFIPPKYENHFDYCRATFNYPYKLYIFNRYNYTPSKERSYTCFNLYSKKQNHYVLEFSIGDKLTVENMKQLFLSIERSIDSLESLQILCNTETIRDSVAFLQQGVALSPSELYKTMPVQIIHSGDAIGTLKKDSDSCTHKDIILIEKEFISPPIGAAYIVSKPVTPLSHIAMLAHSQKAPLIYLNNLDTILNYLNSSVELHVSDNKFTLSKHTSTNNLKKQSNKLLKLKIHNTKHTLLNIDNCSYHSRFTIGNKAANFAELQKLASDSTFLVPEEAFAITFSAYEEHIKASGLTEMISTLAKDTTKLSLNLKLIRHRLKREPLSPKLLDSITNRLEDASFKRFRFRSSSNVEDVENFSGAGLYSSKSASKGDRQAIEKAVKGVWASLWSERAFKERSRVGIDQTTARMGILVHRSFPNEKNNGVVITENLFDRNAHYGFTFNVQLGDIPVVTNDTTHTAELFVSYFDNNSDFYNRTNSIDYITYSSLSQKPILSQEEVKKLTKILKQMERHLYKRWNTKKNFKQFSIDIEFKTDTDTADTNKLYIKQVRPY